MLSTSRFSFSNGKHTDQRGLVRPILRGDARGQRGLGIPQSQFRRLCNQVFRLYCYTAEEIERAQAA
jgi:hypothetical protein